jgi:hypothetical protein
MAQTCISPPISGSRGGGACLATRGFDTVAAVCPAQHPIFNTIYHERKQSFMSQNADLGKARERLNNSDS